MAPVRPASLYKFLAPESLDINHQIYVETRNWPVLFNWYTTCGIYVRHVRRTDVSGGHHAPLILNVFRVSYCASCRTSSPESLGAVSITNAKIGICTDVITVMDLKTMHKQNSCKPSYFTS